MSFSNVVSLADHAAKIGNALRKINGKIAMISHYDADGICAASLLYSAFQDRGKDVDLIFLKQLDRDTIKELENVDASVYVFSDLGSGQLTTIREFFGEEANIVVVDHHQPQDEKWHNLHHLNPYHFGIDGSMEISGAGMAYILSRTISKRVRELIDLTVVGAFADMQVVDNNLIGLNKLLYEDAELFGVVKKEKGLMLFGRYTKPLHKVLEQSMDPYIEGITGNESAAVQFLSELGIPLRDSDGKFRTLADLTKREEKKLATALIMECAANGLPSEKISALIGDVYKIRGKYEVREFATLLNACGRIGKPMEGVDFCLGKRENVEELYNEYRRTISSALSWISRNRRNFIKTDRATYILAGDNIPDTIVGTVLSISMKTHISTPVGFSFANSCNGVKVSARSKLDVGSINLGLVVRKASEHVGGEGGGHKNAAGAKIPMGTEREFIDVIESLL